jgi:CBS-domain-containing membrane protein
LLMWEMIVLWLRECFHPSSCAPALMTVIGAVLATDKMQKRYRGYLTYWFLM